MFKKYFFVFKCYVLLFLARLKGFKFIIAKSDEELKNVFHLRWLVYGKEGYIESSKYKDKMLKDHYDNFSISFLALHKGKPVASVRLIPDSEYNFPTENLFNIKKVENRKTTCEIARLIILPSYRGADGKYGRILMFGLAFSMYRYSKKNNVTHWIANMPHKLENYYRKFGVQFIELPFNPPTEKNLESREVIRGYFSKNTLYPFLVDLSTIPSFETKFKKFVLKNSN
jgi:N-acyl-L-homoserine lactone synthetase